MKKGKGEGRTSSLKKDKRGINMKKTLIVFLTTVLAMSMLFVSCSNEAKIDSSPVEISFGASKSRSLSANVSFEDFDNLNWYYKATLESGEFSQGATGENFVKLNNGLSTQIAFSQGIWNFELKATKGSGENEAEIYTGSRNGVLIQRQQDGSIVTVQIDVMPSSVTVGTIVIDPNVNVGGKKVNKVKIGDGNAVELSSSGINSFIMPAKTYDVTLTYEKTVSSNTVAATQIEYGSETITVTVYGGAVTTISGDISEITQTVVIKPVGKFSTTSSTTISSNQEVTLESTLTPAMDADVNNYSKTKVTLPASIDALNGTGNKSVVLTTTVYPVEEAITNENFTVTGSNNTTVAAIDLQLSVNGSSVSEFKNSSGNDVAVTVETYILKGLNNISVKYNGTDGDPTVVSYDSSSGKLIFTTTHFSEFYVVSDAVCYVVETNTAYETLADAINGASDGDTVVLLDNTSISNTSNTVYEGTDIGYACIFIQDKGITIDGNGKVITLSANEPAGSTYGIYITGTDNSKTVTIKNTTINTTNLERAIRTYGSIGFKIVDSKITTNGVGVHVKGSNKAEIINTQITVDVIDNNVYSAHKRAGVVVGGSDANVKVDGCTINAINTDKNNNTEDDGYQNTWCKGLYAGTSAKNGVLTVNNTKVVADFSIAIDGTGDSGNPSQITINSGEYSGIIGSPSGGSYKSLTINGGTFTGIENYKSFYGKDDSVAKLVISGGTFNVKPDSQFIVDGKCAVAQDDKWIVQSLAVIGTKGYATLEDAVRDAKDGDTIVMLRDSAGNGIGLYSGATGNQIPTKNITIDLNGFTYTIDGSLQGSTGTVSQAFHLEQGCAVTIKNGTIASTKANMLIQNYCNLTLDKMVLDFNKDYPLSNNQGNITIKDTTITSKGGDGIAFDVYSFGNYKGTTVTVEGNSIINGTVELDRTNSASLSLIIENGTFNKDISKKKNENCTVVIKGGTFSCDPTGYVDSNVYHVIENGNTWTVTAK